MRTKTRDYIIIGFALFSMFFGAGNLIFPPTLGQSLGEHYWLGVIGFTIMGVGLPLLGLIACTKNNGNFEEMSAKVGPIFSKIYSIILFLLIGPLLAIPRTAATTFEISILPHFPNFNQFLFVIIYFAINLLFVLRPTKVIESIGKYLTPLLLLILSFLLIKGFLSPIGDFSTATITNPLSHSLIEGYQTMDAIASIIFASLIIGSVRSKGYEKREVIGVTIKASIIAILGLAIIYGGLIFLGSKTGNLATDMNNSQMLLFLSKSILGNIGTTAIGVAFGVACLTTSIGLLSAGGEFFERISGGKFKYSINVLVMAVISILFANFGLNNIIAFSGTILGVIYPVSIVIILLNLFDSMIKSNLTIRYSAYTTLFVSLLTFLGSYVPFINKILSFLPLQSVGFGWILPFIVAFIISNYMLKHEKKSSFRYSNNLF
ncbi:MAG: branched-chain amino acid transport system II carrier protein [Sarcina sp.]